MELNRSCHLNRKILTLLTASIWIGIFITGLWPFDFFPKNQISWLRGGGGLRFVGYGQVYSSAPVVLPIASSAAAKATFELIFTPSKPYNTASTVLAIINQDEMTFAIGQSLTDLFLQGSFAKSDGKPVLKLWIDHVCDQAQEMFVTVTLEGNRVDVYLDGRLARSFPVLANAGNLSGKIVVGHRTTGTGQWSGSVARLAIAEGALDAMEISRRFEQWTAVRHLEPEASHSGVVYEFVSPARDFVRNETGSGPDLIIPKTFRLVSYNILEWPAHLDRSVGLDALVNIAGFIPFGLVTCLYMRLSTHWNISWCIIMTILAGAAVSLSIELLQVLLPTRDSSLADVVTNILGTVIGAGGALIGKLGDRRPTLPGNV